MRKRSAYFRTSPYDLPVRQRAFSNDIFLARNDGTDEVPLVQHPANDRNPFWAPDGKSIIFTSNRGGSPGLWKLHIALRQPDGIPQLLKSDSSGQTPLRISRDGTYYYFTTQPPQREVYVAQINQSRGRLKNQSHQLSQHFPGVSTSPVWSPDGRQLAYYSRRIPDILTLIIHDSRSGGKRELVTTIKRTNPIWWFPDGRSLLIADQDNQSRTTFYRMDIRTGQSTLIHQPTRPIGPLGGLSHNGRKIFYMQPDETGTIGKVKAYDIEAAQEMDIASITRPPVITSMSVSKDGNNLALLAYYQDLPRESALQILPLTGGERREIVKGLDSSGAKFSGLDWSPNGKHVYLVQAKNEVGIDYEMWRVAVPSGSIERLGFSKKLMNNPRVHPDGQRIAFDGSEEGARLEVWAWGGLANKK